METRNRLAFLATYNNILFIDADSKVDHPDFLAKYFAEISRGTQLVTGGRIYSKEKPACEHMLHWKYGSTRENYNTGQPAFMSNNFLVRKDLFQQLSKTTRLEGYGHEDSWWGIQFEKMGAHVKTIDNPVIHASLSTNENFLQKSEQALVNLLLLAKHEDQALLKKHIRIYRVYKKFQSSRLKHIFLFLERIMSKHIRKNLLSCNPSLRYFDWYRLAKLFSLVKNQSGH